MKFKQIKYAENTIQQENYKKNYTNKNQTVKANTIYNDMKDDNDQEDNEYGRQ